MLIVSIIKKTVIFSIFTPYLLYKLAFLETGSTCGRNFTSLRKQWHTLAIKKKVTWTQVKPNLTNKIFYDKIIDKLIFDMEGARNLVMLWLGLSFFLLEIDFEYTAFVIYFKKTLLITWNEVLLKLHEEYIKFLPINWKKTKLYWTLPILIILIIKISFMVGFKNSWKIIKIQHPTKTIFKRVLLTLRLQSKTHYNKFSCVIVLYIIFCGWMKDITLGSLQTIKDHAVTPVYITEEVYTSWPNFLKAHNIIIKKEPTLSEMFYIVLLWLKDNFFLSCIILWIILTALFLVYGIKKFFGHLRKTAKSIIIKDQLNILREKFALLRQKIKQKKQKTWRFKRVRPRPRPVRRKQKQIVNKLVLIFLNGKEIIDWLEQTYEQVSFIPTLFSIVIGENPSFYIATKLIEKQPLPYTQYDYLEDTLFLFFTICIIFSISLIRKKIDEKILHESDFLALCSILPLCFLIFWHNNWVYIYLLLELSTLSTTVLIASKKFNPYAISASLTYFFFSALAGILLAIGIFFFAYSTGGNFQINPYDSENVYMWSPHMQIITWPEGLKESSKTINIFNLATYIYKTVPYLMNIDPSVEIKWEEIYDFSRQQVQKYNLDLTNDVIFDICQGFWIAKLHSIIPDFKTTMLQFALEKESDKPLLESFNVPTKLKLFEEDLTKLGISSNLHILIAPYIFQKIQCSPCSEAFTSGEFFIILAFLIKLGCFPFHNWNISVTGAAPIHITAYIQTIYKLLLTIIFIIIIQILEQTKSIELFLWSPVFITLGLITMFICTTTAISQSTIKQFWAHLSTANIGFLILLIGIQAFTIAIGYAIIYTIASLIFFEVLLLGQKNFQIQFLTDLKKLNNLRSELKLCLIYAILILSGLPPFFAFFIKLLSYLYILKIIGPFFTFLVMVTQLITCFLYLKIIKIILFEKKLETNETQENLKIAFPPIILPLQIILISYITVNPKILFETIKSIMFFADLQKITFW